jgi:hypothetical protein
MVALCFAAYCAYGSESRRFGSEAFVSLVASEKVGGWEERVLAVCWGAWRKEQTGVAGKGESDLQR